MKIALLDITNKKIPINKDLAGGFGTAISIGSSWRAKLVEFFKRKNIVLPLMSFGYLSAIFQKQGHEVEYIRNKIPDAELIIMHPSIINYKDEVAFAEQIKIGTKARIGFIGPFASVKPELFKIGDFIIAGEPEGFFIQAQNINKLNGIIKSEFVKDLSKLPFPDWSKFPIQEYSYYPLLKKKPFLTSLSSRGCTYSCRYYCPYAFSHGRQIRTRVVGNVTAEIDYLVENYNIRSLFFRDTIFTYDKKRIIGIAKHLADLGIDWACETRLDLLDEEMISIMAKCNLKAINFGIESANEQVLKAAKRNIIGMSSQENLIRICEDNSIIVSLFYIFGLPSDIEETIKETIDYAKKLNTFISQFTIFTPYPGTEAYENLKGKIAFDFSKFNGFTPIFKHPNLTNEGLLKLKEKAFLDYYFRLSYAIKHRRTLIK